MRTVATQKLHTQGNIVNTENNLDMAITGRGFYQVLLPDGDIAYSRDGAFQLDNTGQIVTAGGFPIQPALTVPSDALSVSVSSDGIVSVRTPGSPTPSQIGSLQLADFVNPAGLQADGNNLYLETAASGSPTIGTPGLNGVGTIVQGALETSNVNVVTELVNMIETQRAYEMNSKAIQTNDEMLQFIANAL